MLDKGVAINIFLKLNTHFPKKGDTFISLTLLYL